MLCEKGWYVMSWLFWYLFIGLVIGAYGKATSGRGSGALYADIITLILFILFWPLILYMIFSNMIKGENH